MGNLCSKCQANEAEKQQDEVEKFGAEVFLTQEEGSVCETDEHTATAHHTDDAYHRVGVGEGIEIHHIRGSEEDAHADDGGMPVEGLLTALRPPEEGGNKKHQ